MGEGGREIGQEGRVREGERCEGNQEGGGRDEYRRGGE